MINKKLLCSVLSLALLVTGCGSAASSTTAADKNIPADTAAAAEASSGAEESSAAESSAAEQSEAPADEAVADVPGTPEEETAPAAEQAAEEGLASSRSLEIPYRNLSMMLNYMGKKQESSQYIQKAEALKTNVR